MATTYSITCGLPSLNNTLRREQTEFSLYVRVTALAVGILLALMGTLILLGVPHLNLLGTTKGWTCLSLGLVLAMAGASMKCVAHHREASRVAEEPPPLPSIPMQGSNLPEDLLVYIAQMTDNRTLLAFARLSKTNFRLVSKHFRPRLMSAFFEEAAFLTWEKGVASFDAFDLDKFPAMTRKVFSKLNCSEGNMERQRSRRLRHR